MKRFFLLFILIIVTAYSYPSYGQLSLSRESARVTAVSNFSSMPISFTENRGQWDSRAFYKAEAGGATFWFCRNEVVYQFIRGTGEPIDDGLPQVAGMPEEMPDKFHHPRYKKESLVLRAEFVGANTNPEITGADRLSYNNNYFLGNDPSKWATDVPNYSSITYKDIYPGIDLCYHGNGTGMKYDFIIAPGADISKIRIKYEGVNNLSVSNNGELEASTAFGLVYEKIPVIYQEIEGERRVIAGEYALKDDASFGFEITGEYNPNYAMVIDPELVYSTYLGGNDNDYGRDIAVDEAGCAYVTGATFSTDFPVYNPFQPNDQPWEDGFVTKFSSAGNSLIYSTYLGGNDADRANGIAVDSCGYAYITGFTHSSNFPLQNAYQGTQSNGFITKLSPLGDSLIYSTYTTGLDGGSDVTVDPAGNAFITGMTYQFDHGGDAFVIKMSPLGDSLLNYFHFGGSDEDWGFGIAVDNEENAYVIGATYSPDFPRKNAFQNRYGGGWDCFVAKISTSGDSLIYGTYLGGSGDDIWMYLFYGPDIVVDTSGHAYVTGQTNSTDFPTQNPYQDTYHGGYDAFVTELSAGGDYLIYSTYLGGTGWDYGYGIAVDTRGNAYVTGSTSSDDFPLQDPYQNQPHGIFITEFSPSGQSLIFSTYLGGTYYYNDEALAIAIDSLGNTYLTGLAESNDFPMVNPLDSTYNGNGDIFVAKFGNLTDINNDNNPMPSIFSLSQNYPNPFNAQTTIAYSISRRSEVAMDIFDILGRKIACLSEGVKESGSYQAIWDARGFSSGIYFYRLRAGDYQETKRMTLLK